MADRTCSICGTDKPLDAKNFRWREQDGKGYYTAECKACIAKAKKDAAKRAKAKRKAALSKIEQVGVDLFVNATGRGGSNIPHTAELVERVFQYFGGVGGFGAVLVKQYWDSPPGGSARNRLLETMCRLVTKNVESGGAKKPLQLWSDEELEQELEQRLTEAVSAFQGITIDATQEEARRIEAPAPQSEAAAHAEDGRHDPVPAGVDQGTPERDSGPETGGAAAVSAEPESGSDPRHDGE